MNEDQQKINEINSNRSDSSPEQHAASDHTLHENRQDTHPQLIEQPALNIEQLTLDEDVDMDRNSPSPEASKSRSQGVSAVIAAKQDVPINRGVNSDPRKEPTQAEIRARLEHYRTELSQLRAEQLNATMNGMQARPDLVQSIVDRQEFIRVLESHLDMNNQAERKQNPSEHSAHSGEQLLGLQDTCPRFGVPVTNQTTKYKIIQKPHEFLAEFHMHACNYLGRNFQTQCRRLLLQAILDRVKSTQVSDALDNADKNNDPKTTGLGRPRSNWELCESSFIEKTTTENERCLEIEEQLKAG